MNRGFDRASVVCKKVPPLEMRPLVRMTNETEISESKDRLRTLLQADRQNKWELGDELIYLTSIDPKSRACQLNVVALEFDESESYLSQLRSTSIAYPPELRNLNKPWYAHHVARTVAKRAARELMKKTGIEQEPEYSKALDFVAPESGGAIKDQREATHGFTKLNKEKIRPAVAVAAAVAAARNQGALDTCVLGDAVEYLSTVADSSIKVIHLDPPYGQYKKFRNGRLDHSTSAAAKDGDNLDGPDALRTTVETIHAAKDKLVTGGCILLWQAGYELRREILDAIDESGFEIDTPVIWDKKRTQPTDFLTPYTQRIEIMWVIKRKGDMVLNHDESDRDNVLDQFAPVRQDSASLDDHHMFEKPLDLMEFLVNKHTHEGDTILDLFACTGTMSIAAIRLNRKWVYVESHQANFEMGQLKIVDELAKAKND